MQGFIARDLYPTIGSQGAVVSERKLIQLQHNENQIRRDRDVGRNPILDAGGNRRTPEITCEVGYGLATKFAYEQRGDRTRSGERGVFQSLHHPDLPGNKFKLPFNLTTCIYPFRGHWVKAGVALPLKIRGQSHTFCKSNNGNNRHK